jgi:hypothetical protein
MGHGDGVGAGKISDWADAQMGKFVNVQATLSQSKS